MAEARALYRLKSPLSRFERDAEGRLHAVYHQSGDVITPSEAELRDFADRLEPVTGAAASAGAPPAAGAPAEPGAPEERTPAEGTSTSTRSRR